MNESTESAGWPINQENQLLYVGWNHFFALASADCQPGTVQDPNGVTITFDEVIAHGEYKMFACPNPDDGIPVYCDDGVPSAPHECPLPRIILF